MTKIQNLFTGKVNGINKPTACKLPQIFDIASANGWQVVEYNPLEFAQYLLNIGKYEGNQASVIFRREDTQIVVSFTCRRSAAERLAGYLHNLLNGGYRDNWLTEFLGRIQLYCTARVYDVETLESVDAFAQNELLNGFDWDTINPDTVFMKWHEENYSLELTTMGDVDFTMFVCKSDISNMRSGKISLLDLPVHVINYWGC